MNNNHNLKCPALSRGHQGFTLLEVMIAVAILAITLVTLFGSQSKSLSLATEAKFNALAPMLALAKLAEMESGQTAIENDRGTFGEDFSEYTWEIELTNVAYDVPEGLAQLDPPLSRVELTVSWDGTPFSYQLVYYDQSRN